MSDETRTCSRCGHEGVTEECPTCVREWESRRDAATMTPEERLAEFNSWTGILEVAFPKMHERVEELVGRPVWTHELASLDYLRHEIQTGHQPTMEGVLAKLPPDLPVITIQTDGGDDR